MLSGRLAGVLHRRQQERDQDRDDRDHHQHSSISVNPGRSRPANRWHAHQMRPPSSVLRIARIRNNDDFTVGSRLRPRFKPVVEKNKTFYEIVGIGRERRLGSAPPQKPMRPRRARRPQRDRSASGGRVRLSDWPWPWAPTGSGRGAADVAHAAAAVDRGVGVEDLPPVADPRGTPTR